MNQSKPNVQQPVKASSGEFYDVDACFDDFSDPEIDGAVTIKNKRMTTKIGIQIEEECAKLRRYLQTIRDTGMTAEQAAEHAASALTTKANSE